MARVPSIENTRVSNTDIIITTIVKALFNKMALSCKIHKRLFISHKKITTFVVMSQNKVLACIAKVLTHKKHADMLAKLWLFLRRCYHLTLIC